MYDRSSMLNDTLKGNATEIDSINGEIVRAGVKYGIPTPANRYMHI
jgi:2-dehydropantoate 2-reductase